MPRRRSHSRTSHRPKLVNKAEIDRLLLQESWQMAAGPEVGLLPPPPAPNPRLPQQESWRMATGPEVGLLPLPAAEQFRRLRCDRYEPRCDACGQRGHTSGNCPNRTSDSRQRLPPSAKAFGVGSLVWVWDRQGEISWDGRPEHDFVQVVWGDDGTESGVLPVEAVSVTKVAPRPSRSRARLEGAIQKAQEIAAVEERLEECPICLASSKDIDLLPHATHTGNISNHRACGECRKELCNRKASCPWCRVELVWPQLPDRAGLCLCCPRQCRGGQMCCGDVCGFNQCQHFCASGRRCTNPIGSRITGNPGGCPTCQDHR